ncbi:precorrin-3B C(17)-methyltransferase [Candidatus Kirkpatrickella diaphorinae]|uniref:Precorrin-3B C(17)-methyltransferase n=1 Tax=Candidatus Kirkpatrickella diaphorinae TaxID=2984322 RepID=A0ABY6GI86_9PROT|nr:precorrin-3B C(17)-methyltransferase [Candidatus Kirkpatrickella diaphorinae]UYH51221.1 precorrin-3B C(17)-methyltransferase [Candidatus Kirkpatrickella diaphorinae]
MSRLYVIGIGPGSLDLLTPEAREALGAVTHVYGYGPYLSRIQPLGAFTCHASDNGDEVARARQALAAAENKGGVALISGGDAGVFGMASALFEAMETGPAAWRAVDVKIVPGVTAVLAAASRLGAPLGNDFVIMSLSDNLKPWAVIEKRLIAAAQGDFVIALYNARSRARPDQLANAFDCLRTILPPETEVAFAHHVTRPDERLELSTLADCEAQQADMATLVLIGARSTRRVARPDGKAWLYTPRSVSEA